MKKGDLPCRSSRTAAAFLTGLSGAGAAGLIGAPSRPGAEPPPETTTRPPAEVGPAALAAGRRNIWPENCYAPRALPMSAMCKATRRLDQLGVDRQRRHRFQLRTIVANTRSRRSTPACRSTVLAGLHSGCLELIANDSVHSIPELKGKRVGIHALGSLSACFARPDGRLCRARSGQRYRVDCRSGCKLAKDLFARRQRRCISRHSARAAGIARREDRPYHRQHAPSTGPGRSISAACFPATAIL